MKADELIEAIKWICVENDTDLEDAEIIIKDANSLYLKIDNELYFIK